jgi:molybdopterin-guanine dinucleotide biosynthesis protein A
MTLAAAILAGGAATRLGGADKALLDLAGRTALDHLLRRLSPQAGPICLSANGDPSRFAATRLPVIADDPVHRGMGPLAGLAAALAWAQAQGAETLLAVPADTPFIPPDLAARLAPAPSLAEAGGRAHHLVCLLPVMSRPVLVARLAQGHTRAAEFLTAIGARRVVFSDPTAFININTPDDLARARALAGPVSLQSPPP